MARIKNGITKSGASLLNERTQAIKLEIYNQQMNQPYIPNGTNVDKLSIVKKYNDQNTINFDNLKYSTPQAYFSQHPNERSILDELIATPSTMPDDLGLDISPNFYNNFPNNQSNIINKFLKKVNLVQINHTPFNNEKLTPIENIINDIEASRDFIRGEGEYSFLDTNMYEEMSIDIELDNPTDIILQNTAYIQKESFSNENSVNKNTYSFNSLNNSNYDIRKNAPTNIPRLNTPFVIYNFDKKCWEYRGMPKPYDQINKTNTQKYVGKLENITIPAADNIKILPDIIKGEIDAIFPDLYNYDSQDFKKYFEKYLLHQNPLTNVPIINPRIFDDVQSANGYSGISLPTSQFGFPIERKFHAFSDNILNLSKYINKTFIVDRISYDNVNVELLSEINNPYQNSLTNIPYDGFNASLNFHLIKQEKLSSSQKIIPKNNNSYDPFKYNTTFESWQLPNFSFPDNNLIYRVYAEENTQYSSALLIGNPDNSNYTLDDFLSEIPDNEINSKRSIITFSNVVFHNMNNSEFSSILKDNCDKFIICDNTNNNLNLMTADYVGNIKFSTYVKKPNFENNIFNSHIFNKQIEMPTGLNFYDINSATRDFLNNLNGKDLINSLGQNKNLLLNRTDDEFIYIRKDLLDPRTNTLESPDDNPNLLFSTETSPNIWEYPDNKLTHFVSNYKIDKKSNYSPYVLSPEDNISVCLSISPLIISELIKQQLKIKSGKIKLTLHGYQKRNNKIFIDDTSLNQNLNTSIISDNSIVTDDYNNVGYLDEFILTFNDRIFQGTFNDENNPRKLKGLEEQTANFDNSKIKSGKSYIPYIKLEPAINTKWIYDNDVVFNQILTRLSSTNNQSNIDKYLTPYRGVDDPNIPNINPPLSNNFDQGEIEYFDFNIAAATAPFKLDLKSLEGPITEIRSQFQSTIDELLSIPILGAIIAAAFILDKLSTGGFINRRHNFSSYYSSKKYGQFINTLQQRLFTTEMSLDVNNIPVVEYVLEQKFIDNTTGVELTDLTNSLIPRNKSKNLQLIDSRNTAWSVEDFFKLKHVAYDDTLTEIFI